MQALVVAVDFSKPSRKAFEWAMEMAGDLEASLVLVHAFEPMPRMGVRDPIGEVEAEVDASEWQEISEAWAAEARRTLDVHTVAREGKPADVVLGAARDRRASFIVVGSHGRTGLKRAVLGSVAEAVVRGSAVPVVVVPA